MATAAPELLYFPSSPFARMARVLAREWRLDVTETEVRFPPPDGLFAANPLGQVPVLLADGAAIFPTFEVLMRLWAVAGRPAGAYRPESERQLLLTVLAAGDAVVAALYQRWAGLRNEAPNHIGYDPAERNLARFRSVLAWMDDGRLRAGVTLPGVAAACILIWSEARGGPAWQGYAPLERLVGDLAERESFRETRPSIWRPGEEEAR